MSDTIVKTERFFDAYHEVKLLTVEANMNGYRAEDYCRYYCIIKSGAVEFTSPLFLGGSREDVIRNCDSALQVVRKLLTDTGFLTGEVVGA